MRERCGELGEAEDGFVSGLESVTVVWIMQISLQLLGLIWRWRPQELAHKARDSSRFAVRPRQCAWPRERTVCSSVYTCDSSVMLVILVVLEPWVEGLVVWDAELDTL
jgi:hypothetical protein